MAAASALGIISLLITYTIVKDNYEIPQLQKETLLKCDPKINVDKLTDTNLRLVGAASIPFGVFLGLAVRVKFF